MQKETVDLKARKLRFRQYTLHFFCDFSLALLHFAFELISFDRSTWEAAMRALWLFFEKVKSFRAMVTGMLRCYMAVSRSLSSLLPPFPSNCFFCACVIFESFGLPYSISSPSSLALRQVSCIHFVQVNGYQFKAGDSFPLLSPFFSPSVTLLPVASEATSSTHPLSSDLQSLVEEMLPAFPDAITFIMISPRSASPLFPHFYSVSKKDEFLSIMPSLFSSPLSYGLRFPLEWTAFADNVLSSLIRSPGEVDVPRIVRSFSLHTFSLIHSVFSFSFLSILLFDLHSACCREERGWKVNVLPIHCQSITVIQSLSTLKRTRGGKA